MKPLERCVALMLILLACTGCSFGFGKPLTTGGDTGITREPAMTEGVGSIAWYRSGDPDAPRILYIHGTPGSARDYEAYLLDPLPGHESVAVDRIGFGNAGAGPDRHGALVSFERQAAAIAPLLVQRDGKKTLLVGHSLGGPIALRLAADYPDQVAGVVVLAGSVDPELEKLKWFNYALELPLMGLFLGDAIQRSNTEVFGAEDQTVLLAEVLPRVTCPVIAVHGREDALVPFANTDYLRDHLPNAASFQRVELPDADHFIPWTHPEAVRQAIRKLIELRDSPPR